MSLQGSLDTFALPDVLVLLATTKKTGELRVTGSNLEGRLWMAGGEVVGGVAGRATAPVDAVFELLRLDSGDFVFDHAIEPRREVEPLTATDLLEEAQARLVEWRDIEQVIPSLSAVAKLAPEAPGDEVVVTKSDWRVLAALGSGKSVLRLSEALALGEFDTCRQLKAMFEAGLITVDATAVEEEPAPAPSAAAPEPEPEPAPVPVVDIVAEERSGEPETDPEPPAPPHDDEPRAADAVAADDADEPASRPAKTRQTRSRKPEADMTSPESELARAALAEVAAPVEAPVRSTRPAAAALADQLAALGVDEEAVAAEVQAEPEPVPAPEPAAPAAEAEEPEPPVSDDGQPIDRGLLLKFLSSVRS